MIKLPVLPRPDRRTVLAAAAGLVLGPRPSRAATPRPLRLLAPAAYGDDTFLSILGKHVGTGFELDPLATDDDALAPLRPLGPAATAAARRARPALAVTAHPWPRGILWPEGVIAPLAKQVSPTTTELAPGLVPSLATLETGLEGRYFLGRGLRFDLAAMIVDRRRVSVDAVGDLGLGLLDDPVLRGRYALVADPRSLLATAMLYAGLDPFRLQRPSELRRLEPALHQLVSRAGMIARTPAEAIAAIVDGKVDLALPLGLGASAPARLQGHGHLAAALPRVGPLGGRAAFYWVEIMTVVAQAPAEAAKAMAVADEAEAMLALTRSGGGLHPVASLADPAIAGRLTAAERAALDLELWPGLLAGCAAMGLMPERTRLAPLLDQALSEAK
ncbi:MAG: hypothetical protein PHS60_04590 [Zavarzinia sp.]|nr:hypothetical protein [Zavarzinia sp.]